MLEGFRGDGALQRLPTPIGVFKEHVLDEPLPIPSLRWGRFTNLMTCQGTFESLTHGGSDASLLAQLLNGLMASTDYLQTIARVCLVVIPSADEVFRNLGTFDFVAL